MRRVIIRKIRDTRDVTIDQEQRGFWSGGNSANKIFAELYSCSQSAMHMKLCVQPLYGFGEGLCSN